jgi:hypothetical protein
MENKRVVYRFRRLLSSKLRKESDAWVEYQAVRFSPLDPQVPHPLSPLGAPF